MAAQGQSTWAIQVRNESGGVTVWTYTGSPSSSASDEVRWLSGDTLADDPLVTDEEVAYALTAEGASVPAAALVCESLAARFARMVDKSVGDLRLSASQKATAFTAKAVSLRMRAAQGSMPYAGGVSNDERNTARADTDLIQPAFSVDSFTTPGSVSGGK